MTISSGILPLWPQLFLHAFVRDVPIEFVDHIGTGAGVLGQHKHIDTMDKLLADIKVPE